MKRILLLLAIIAMSVLAASAQDVPPVIPCGLGQPDNVPCYDTNAGKVIHTDSRMALPHENLEHPLPSGTTSDAPVVVPKIHASSVSQPKPLVQSSPPTPYWTYKGSSAYYHDGGHSQRIEIDNLQSAVQNSQNFANGEAIGGGLEILIARWLSHRRKVKLERKNTKQQIIAYYNATLSLNQQVERNLKGIEANADALVSLPSPKPKEHRAYEQLRTSTITLEATVANLPALLAKDRPVVLASKDRGFLRNMLGGAKKLYDLSLNGDRQSYMGWQATGVLVGYFRWKQANPTTR